MRVRVRGVRVGDTFATREEADRQRAALVVSRRRVAEVMPKEPAALTLGAWGDQWLAQREELGKVRRPENDRSRWRRFVAGTPLAAKALDAIGPGDVEAWLDATVRRFVAGGGGKVSAQTVRHAFNLVRVAFRDAARRELVLTNPCDIVQAPKSAPKVRPFLTAAEVERVVAGAPGVPELARRVFAVAIFTGLREGEVIALRWGDVTLEGEHPEVHVQRSHNGPPKNGKARKVPVRLAALDALRAHHADAVRAGAADLDDLVFPSPRGHQRQPGDDFGWSKRKARRGEPQGYRAAFGITSGATFHSLRHTCGTHLVAGTWFPRMPLDVVRDFLGHSSVNVTERYAHALVGHLHGAVGAVEALPAALPPSVAGTAPESSPVEVFLVPSDAASGRGTNCTVGRDVIGPRLSRNTARPARLERATLGLEGRGGTLAPPGNSRVVGHAWAMEVPPGPLVEALAGELLRAVDEGLPAGTVARELAVAVLRSAPTDSPPWHRAVAVLEGGPLRMRHAVELAGDVLEAVAAGDVGRKAGGA